MTIRRGTAPITCQWRKNGQEIAGAVLPTWNLAHALAADAGIYTVVDNEFGPAVAPAAIAVVPVKVARFINVSSVQFSAHWDTNVFAYEGLEQFGLTSLAVGNFGLPAPGALTLSWEDPSGGSTSLPDQTVIFAIRLRATGAGVRQVTIDGEPTLIEILDGSLTAIPVTVVPGLVTIQGGQALDTDGDGLSDEREAQLGTDPRNPDTDGDGYAAGLEVQLGTDPKLASSRPEALSIYTAIELEMVTLTNRQYQLEKSVDMQTWTGVGEVFQGSGNVTNRFLSTKGSPKIFWRLKTLP